MKRCKKLTIKEYGSSYYFNKKSDILNLTQKESNLTWSKSENPPLPKYQKIKFERIPLSAGWWNLIRNLRP